MAAQLGVSEAWLRWGQEELSLSGRRLPQKLSLGAPARVLTDKVPTSEVLTVLLVAIDRISDSATRARALRAAAAAVIESAVRDGEILPAGYDALAQIDAWLVNELRRGKTEIIDA
jgi:hypothetical protein